MAIVEAEFDRSSDYKRYIKSESWRTKRRQYFAQYGDDCKGCGERTPHTHVHHKTYERFGNEDLNDLVSVCEACHSMIHQRHQLGGVTLEEATESVLDRIRQHRKKILVLEGRRTAKRRVHRVVQREPNTASKKYQRRFARAAATAVTGTRRTSAPSRSWQERNDEYVKLREREEARRRTV